MKLLASLLLLAAPCWAAVCAPPHGGTNCDGPTTVHAGEAQYGITTQNRSGGTNTVSDVPKWDTTRVSVNDFLTPVPKSYLLSVHKDSGVTILRVEWPQTPCESWRMSSENLFCYSFAPDKKDVGMEFTDKDGRKWRAKWEPVN